MSGVEHRSRPLLRWVERALMIIGVVALSYCGWVFAETYLYQSFENRELEKILASAPAATTATAARSVTVRAVAAGSTIGRIEIPRLGVTAIVRAGSDARTLQLAVGHIPGTAYPGERGNVGLAGHRDTFFRRLRDIRADDAIEVVTAEGRFTYRVQRTDIVQPSDVWVLDPTSQPSLTLVTCYPFSYVGAAPERFIVRAALDPGSVAPAS
jgi:sortase A